VIKDEFATSSFEDAWIVGATKAGACIGVFLGGAYMYRHGRKAAIFIDSIFFTVGPLVMASSASVGTIIMGRLLVGLGIGFSAVVVPAYLGEVAPANIRGSVVTLYELMLCVGMVVSSFVDAALLVLFLPTYIHACMASGCSFLILQSQC
jgi:MFS family permease